MFSIHSMLFSDSRIHWLMLLWTTVASEWNRFIRKLFLIVQVLPTKATQKKKHVEFNAIDKIQISSEMVPNYIFILYRWILRETMFLKSQYYILLL